MKVRRSSASSSNARVSQADARRALDRVTGLRADKALRELRFSPQDNCEPVWRVIAAAVANIQRESPGVAEADLVVVSGHVGDGETVTRVRRHAHGNADWITTHTTSIEVELALDGGPALAVVRDIPPAAGQDGDTCEAGPGGTAHTEPEARP
jgi:ribosomal protein L22